MKKYFFNFITSFLIGSFVLTPYFISVSEVKAQSIGGYSSGLGGAILMLPQCNIVGGTMTAIKGLFGGGGVVGSAFGDNLQDDMQKVVDDGQDKMMSEVSSQLSSQIESNLQELNSISTYDREANKKLDDVLENTNKTREATENINQNSSCIQSIGRLIIKMLLQKVTMSTVNWINSGFNGSPAFIQDPSKFFGDIAKNEVLQFGIEINNPELFPFGKVWMRNTAIAFNNKFQDNARYSLDKMIQDTNPEASAFTFGQDFSQGGWNAWNAMTQYPANNPIGFKLMADNELQSRLEGTTQSTAQYVHDALSQANGFLGDQRCVYPEGMTKQQDYEAKVAGKKGCTEWEYVTPGKMVADAATNVIGYQNNAYLNVQDLNDAVAAVLDALLGQFSSNLMEKGFANMGTEGMDGTLVFDNYGSDYRTRTEKDFMPSQLSNSWLSANPNFNIRTDLTQALIDEQRTYSNKLAEQNKEIMSTTDGKKFSLSSDGKSSNAYGLLPVIYQLDYCIPGPHPGYEQDSREALAEATAKIIPETEASLENREPKTVVGAIGSTIGTVITSIPIVGGIVESIFGSDKGKKVRAYYATWIQALTGYMPDAGNEGDDRVGNISNKQGTVQVLNTILDRYVQIMNKTYFSSADILPDVTKEAAVNFNQAKGYNQMVKNNEDKISLLKSTIESLSEIKDKVDELNKEYPEGGDDYEEALKPQINAFGRVSGEMVNGTDIAKADNILKQIKDKKEYIYKNLLKGPYGCEKDLEKNPIAFPSPYSNFNVNTVKRMTYPTPILYDYNQLKRGEEIPDPLYSGYSSNKMPATDSFDIYGPGFLSFVSFSDEANWTRGEERLALYDLLPSTTHVVQPALGLKKVTDAGGTAFAGLKIMSVPGTFESVIKIY